MNEKNIKIKIILLFVSIILLLTISLFVFFKAEIIISKLLQLNTKLIEGKNDYNFYVHKLKLFSIFLFIVTSLYFTAFFGFLTKNIKLKIFNNKFIFLFLFLFSLIISLSPRYITGDEPHYINLAKSIINQGNFELSEYKNISSVHLYKNKNGNYYSIHYPLLSIIIAIPLKIGGIVGVKLFMAILWFLFSFFIIKYINSLNDSDNSKKIIILILLLSSPIGYFSGLIYPDILGALLMVVGLYVIERKNIEKKYISLLIALIISLLLWTSIRFYIIGFFLFLYFIFKKKKIGVMFIATLSTAVVLQMLCFYHWYDNVFPWSMYIGYGIIAKTTPLKALLGIFLDQQSGLFIVAPVYILIFSSLFLSLREKSDNHIFIYLKIFVFLLYVSLLSLAENWNGHWSPSARLMLVLTPLFVSGIIELYEKQTFTFLKRYIFNFLLILSFLWGYIYNLFPDKRNGVLNNEGTNFFINLLKNIFHINLDYIFIKFYRGNIYFWTVLVEIFIIILINYLFINKKYIFFKKNRNFAIR